MLDDKNYFKLCYAFHSTWTLKQAAYLLLGYDPEKSAYRIGKDEANEVSRFYFWLKERADDGELYPQIQGNPFYKPKKPARYNPDQFFALMEQHKKEYEPLICKIRHLIMKNKKENKKLLGSVNKLLYQRAASFIWDKNPKATIGEVSETLVNLPNKLRENYPDLNLGNKTIDEISAYLKGNSPRKKGAPKKEDRKELYINWSEVLEFLG